MPTRLAKKLVVEQRKGELPAMGRVMGPQTAVAAIDRLIGERAYEHFLALYVDIKNTIFAYDEFTSGGIGSVYVQPETIVRNALLVGAVGVITAHQHPSGDPEPSHGDQETWAKINTLLKALSLTALDHLVVARNEQGEVVYYSFAEGRTGRA